MRPHEKQEQKAVILWGQLLPNQQNFSEQVLMLDLQPAALVNSQGAQGQHMEWGLPYLCEHTKALWLEDQNIPHPQAPFLCLLYIDATQ